MKFCSKCGNQLSEGLNFCPNCGAQISQDQPQQQNQYQQQVYNTNMPLIKNRNIAMQVILSILTCGIYGLYWFITMTDESNNLSDEKTASGGMAVLLTLVTCGIYSFYWNYKMGQKLNLAGRKYNKSISDNSVLYLVLSLLGLTIVNYCLIQSDLNKFSNN
ncbi:MAG: DUF4234 domain-containing protein [Tenericutes bacterium]|nr:DUF4234 domain-containing protein [Mycoplasmatota bacterium]